MLMCISLGSQKGFTLIEVIIVMVIIGSVVGLTAPRIGNSLEKMRLRSATRKLAAILRYSRQIAISRKKECTVRVVGDHAYNYAVLEKKSSNTDETDREYLLNNKFSLKENNIKEKKIPIDLYQELKTEKVTIAYQMRDRDEYREEGGPGEIIFFPKGESSGGRITLALKESNLAFYIDVDEITGRVTVKRKDEEAE